MSMLEMNPTNKAGIEIVIRAEMIAVEQANEKLIQMMLTQHKDLQESYNYLFDIYVDEHEGDY